jgi:sulfatase maturation enzyme AslB (radical SAM superfamily)
MPLGVRVGRRALRERAAARGAVPLGWIDDFFREAKAHIFARPEDGVVILPPNQVYKANATGIAIVKHMLGGGRVAAIPGIADEERARQVAAFVSDLRALYLGEAAADGHSPFETVPYTFQYTKLPILGEIAVTYRCNNACVFCYAGCGGKGAGCAAGPAGAAARTPRDTAAGREMTLAESQRVMRIFKEEAKIPFFSFTGGEPLLREDLDEMIAFACRLGLQVNLITNATLASRARARKLFKAGLRTAQVSVESLSPETHDLLTARPGSFASTLEGIANLRAAGDRKSVV